MDNGFVFKSWLVVFSGIDLNLADKDHLSLQCVSENVEIILYTLKYKMFSKKVFRYNEIINTTMTIR